MTISDVQARQSIEALVAHVAAHLGDLLEGITYQELARRICRLDKHGKPYARGMGPVLSRMGKLLEGIEGEWGESIPYIQGLVVQKSGHLKGLPSYGVAEFWPGFTEMSRAEKLNRVKAEHTQIAAFGSRWNRVLQELGLSEVVPEREHKGSRYGSLGESEAHRALKEHVRDRPDIVGLDRDTPGILEYELPSLDTIDVLFKAPAEWVAVEVKSKVSDRLPEDYERGIYQTVKYAALLRAMARDDNYAVPSGCRTMLVLESRLPRQYAGLARAFGTTLVENVAVDGV